MCQLGDVVGNLEVSATDIGRRVGATAMEVNRLLEDQGFLEGEPSAYRLTPKGEEFGAQRDHGNGYGGIAYRAWETTHYDPKIIDVLDCAPGRLEKVRADISAENQEKRDAKRIAQAEADARFQKSLEDSEAAKTPDEIDPRKVAFLLAGSLVLFATVVGVRKGVAWYKAKKVAAEPNSDPSSDGEEI